METTHIYTLSDPNTGLVRYVGKADKINLRLNQHISLSKNPRTHKHSWIKSLTSMGLRPIIEVIDEVPVECWRFWEQHYIKLFKSIGGKLTNMTGGGDGQNMTSELREKIRCNTKGKKHNISENGMDKIIKNLPKTPWNKGAKADDDLREKIRLSHLGIQYKTRWRAILQYTKDNVFIKEWDGLVPILKELGFQKQTIVAACKGRQKSAYGFIWKYKNQSPCP